MPTSVILAPNPFFQGRDKDGNSVVYGQLYTYKTHTDIPKVTYQDPAGLLFNQNPVQLDGSGEALIYWATDEYYRIELYTEGGKETGQLVYTQNNYPFVGGTGADVNAFNAIENFIRNPQFTFWNNTAIFKNYLGAASFDDYIADDWLHLRQIALGTNPIINISRKSFVLGQETVPANPDYYLQYVCSNIGDGVDTYNRLGQRFMAVQTLSGSEVTFSFYAKSPDTISPLTVSFLQDFGLNGSPTVETLHDQPFVLSSSWQKFSGTLVLPPVNGKTLGETEGSLFFCINLPLNALGTIDICNVELVEGNLLPPFRETPQSKEFLRLVSQVINALPKTGETKFTLAQTPYPGWLLCDDGTIGSPKSSATHAGFFTKKLFELLHTYDAAYFPVTNPDGTPAVKTFSVEDDFNSGMRIALPRTLGRVIANQSTVVSNGDVRLATTGFNLVGTYNNGTAGVGATLTLDEPITELDLVPLVVGDRILVKDQTVEFQNGVYIYTSTTVLTRATDYQTSTQIIAGTDFEVEEGTLNHLHVYQMITPGLVTVGTTAIKFAAINAHPVGSFIGSETFTMKAGQLVSHTHSTGIPGTTFMVKTSVPSSAQFEAGTGQHYTVVAHTGVPNVPGPIPPGPESISNMQPTTFMYCMIKL